MDLQELKKRYLEIEKKHKLPPFSKLNEDFEIDKIDKDTDYIARAIRKAMIDKIVNSLNFIEMLLNQMNAPRLYIPFLRTMNGDDKKLMDDLYARLGGLSMLSLELEIDYSEKQESDAIKKIYESWNSIKPDFRKILSKIKNPSLSQSLIKKEKSYFG